MNNPILLLNPPYMDLFHSLKMYLHDCAKLLLPHLRAKHISLFCHSIKNQLSWKYNFVIIYTFSLQQKKTSCKNAAKKKKFLVFMCRIII